MASDDCDPPVFSADSSNSTSGTPLPSFSQLHASTRAVTRVDHQLSDVTLLDNHKYYLPAASNHPLFYSFTIYFDSHAVAISVFHITISPNHEGSAEGYLHIHKLMRRVRELLKETDAYVTVKAAYLLVCPDDGAPYQWRMHVGWKEYTRTNDHRGDGFRIRVPVSGCRGIHSQFCDRA